MSLCLFIENLSFAFSKSNIPGHPVWCLLVKVEKCLTMKDSLANKKMFLFQLYLLLDVNTRQIRKKDEFNSFWAGMHYSFCSIHLTFFVSVCWVFNTVPWGVRFVSWALTSIGMNLEWGMKVNRGTGIWGNIFSLVSVLFHIKSSIFSQIK